MGGLGTRRLFFNILSAPLQIGFLSGCVYTNIHTSMTHTIRLLLRFINFSFHLLFSLDLIFRAKYGRTSNIFILERIFSDIYSFVTIFISRISFSSKSILSVWCFELNCIIVSLKLYCISCIIDNNMI